jgi:hypothetical protein
MKKRGLIALVLVLLVAAVAVVTYRHKPSIKVPAMNDVVSAEFAVSGLLRPGDPVPEPLMAERPEDRAVIAKLLDWMRSAEVAGQGPVALPSMGAHFLMVHLQNNRQVSLYQVRRDGPMMFDTGDGNPVHLASPNLTAWLWDGWTADVKVAGAPAATSPMQLELLAASDSVSRGATIAFTVTFKNAGTSEITVMDPCGHPFNLKVDAGGREIDDWVRQTYGGPPACPPGSGIRVPPGERYSTSLTLRFPTPGTFTVYAINLGTVSGIDGNVRSNQVTIHVR